MISTTCILAWVTVLILLPIIILLWVCESRNQRIKRWHRTGQSQRLIANRLGLNRYQIRKALAS